MSVEGVLCRIDAGAVRRGRALKKVLERRDRLHRQPCRGPAAYVMLPANNTLRITTQGSSNLNQNSTQEDCVNVRRQILAKWLQGGTLRRGPGARVMLSAKTHSVSGQIF